VPLHGFGRCDTAAVGNMFLVELTGITGWIYTAARALYDFAQGLGGPGLFLIALADSSFLSVPEGNDILIVVLSIGQSWEVMLYYVAMTVVGSAIGCSMVYWLGSHGGRIVENRLSPKRLDGIRHQYHRWGVWAIVIPAILPPPTPFKLFVLAAGIFNLPFARFVFAVSLGRSIRYLTWGVLAVLYGPWARQFLERNLHTVGVVLALILLAGIAGYLGMKLKNRLRSRSLA
jgi:membrane protein YqaA with SNARE-associated domain